MRRRTALALVTAATLVAVPSATAGVVTYPSSDVPKFVSDGGTTNSTVSVPAGRTAVQSIEVTGIGYFWAASAQELSTQLAAPDGSSMNLWQVGCSDYPAAATFAITDNATQFPPSGQLPNCDSDKLFGGSFLPKDPQNRRLSFFSGKGSAGTWTLRSIDNGVQFGNQGSLLRWSLRITHAPPTFSASGPGTANVGGPINLSAVSNANGAMTIGGDANPSSTNLAAGVTTAVPFTPTQQVLSQIKKKGTAQATVSLSFADETGGTATSSVAVTLKGKKAKKKKKKKRKKKQKR